MNRNIDPIIQEFVDIIVKNWGDIIVKLILFGSVAKGIPQPDSDCDILVVMKEKRRDVIHNIYGIIVDFSLKYGIEISLKIYTEERYNFGISLPTPFMKEIIKTGKVLWSKI